MKVVFMIAGAALLSAFLIAGLAATFAYATDPHFRGVTKAYLTRKAKDFTK